MPTACSPQDCTSCTSMIGGRSGLYKYLLKIRAVIPLPPVSVRFRFLSSAFLFSSYTVPPLSTKDPVTSLPFPRSTLCSSRNFIICLYIQHKSHSTDYSSKEWLSLFLSDTYGKYTRIFIFTQKNQLTVSWFLIVSSKLHTC